MKLVDTLKAIVQWLMRAWKEIILQCKAILNLGGDEDDKI